MTPPPLDPGFEEELLAWLHAQIEDGRPRRVVRVTPEEILVSKFEPGFAARLHAVLDDLPELSDGAEVIARYRRAATALPADMPRVDVWHASMHAALAEAGARLGLADDRLAEVRAGIDSVRAVLEACLWSQPTTGDAYRPRTGEVAAYLDGLAALEDGRDLFTRYYGDFHGVPVRNHCPGAGFARRLLADGWIACTGTPPPEPAG